MRRREVLAAGVLAGLCACKSAPPPAPVEAPHQGTSSYPAPGTPPVGSSSPLVQRTLATMARIRHLAALHAVPSVTLGRAALIAQVKAHVEREVPAKAIRAEGLTQKLLGFFPVAQDYEAAEFTLLQGQLAGYYEQENGTMYLAADLDAENAASTLAHELVHALQDQHWDLKERSRYTEGQDDKDGAFSALAEGDATSAEIDEIAAREKPGATALDLSDAELGRTLQAGLDSEEAAAAPSALRRALVAPYVEGVVFVNALRRRGGWASVDEAWDHPPETTEQILHPDKWRTHEPAIVLRAPPPPSPDFTLLEANVLGEEGLRLALEEWMTEGAALAAASDWGGDRAALYGRQHRDYAYLWHVRFDAASPENEGAFATRAFTAVTLALPRLGRLETADAREACVDRRGNGVFAVLRDGRDLFFAFGAVTPDANGWQASMTCAAATRWNEAALLAGRPPT